MEIALKSRKSCRRSPPIARFRARRIQEAHTRKSARARTQNFPISPQHGSVVLTIFTSNLGPKNHAPGLHFPGTLEQKRAAFRRTDPRGLRARFGVSVVKISAGKVPTGRHAHRTEENPRVARLFRFRKTQRKSGTRRKRGGDASKLR